MRPGEAQGDTLAAELAVTRGAWRRELAGAIRDLDELWQRLRLPGAPGPAERAAAQAFPLVVPESFVVRMRMGDLTDPLLRQVLPVAQEGDAVPGYGPDPVGESDCSLAPGLLHKYQGRALLVTSGACAVHCRYCFRRHFPYQALPTGRRWWEPARQAMVADGSLEELLLSGGDPLTLPDSLLAELVTDFGSIPHLRRVRIHTRLPVVLPSRVDDALTDWIRASRQTVVVVIHANHPDEIDVSVAAACRRLSAAGAVVLNQSVLLAGVNAQADVLADLSQRLIAAGVVPYYLHQLDPVAGAAHFAVSDESARQLIDQLRIQLPGYLVPRLVREVAGDSSKRPL